MANELIEASAGTGKTQALAERLIALLRAGVQPQEIVALTFSRAAAGEIFERFVSLLAARVERHPDDARLLRAVIATQHLSQIGTLDSFLMRIVRSFPLELGLAGELEILDAYQAASAAARVSFGVLRKTDAHVTRAFVEAFALAMNREDVRSFAKSYRAFVAAWHEQVLAHPDAAAWGAAETIWGGAPPFAPATEADLARAADALAAFDGHGAKWPAFVQWVRDFRGRFGAPTGFAKKFLEQENVFAGATVAFTFSRKEHVFAGAELAAVRGAFAAVFGYVLRLKLELARGVYALIAAYERAYAQQVRGRGRLVFSDIPRLMAQLGANERLALEYRMDAKIRAWALDEFQDTSREQCRALQPLIDEATQSDGEKSVFIVGDRKQAIYGWRNGDVGIFRGEKASGRYRVGELVKTYRSGPAVVEAVNRVFVHGRLKEDFADWDAPEHASARPELGGFVQAFDAPGAKMEDFVEPVFNALQAVQPAARGLSAAVLVRNNKFGALLADRLQQRGMKDVVWEGESDILETPALRGFLDLVQLADHPGDLQTYRHFRQTPLAAADGGAAGDAAAFSAELARAFTTRGLVRVFREWRARLPEDPAAAWSPGTEERFTELVRAAAEFELALEPGMKLSDFIAFVKARRTRTLAEAGKVKIMTIHRSKGLGFDYVVLPLYEYEPLDGEPDNPLVSDRWILPDPGRRVTAADAVLAAAAAERNARTWQEALCTYYVAMTRAKRAMTLVLNPPTKAGERCRFSDYVRAALPEEIGEKEWYRAEAPRVSRPASRDEPPAAAPEAFPRKPRAAVRRRLPSQLFHSGMSAGELFAPTPARSAAIRRGVEEHAALAAIEWIDPAAPKDDRERAILADGRREAFVRPAGFVELWRERAYELLVDGTWESGVIDRVVFAADGATIYDFKTNRPKRDETPAAFAERLRTTYAGQLAAYRRAVAALTGLAPERIQTKLLLSADWPMVIAQA